VADRGTWNPLSSEREAYQLVIAAIVYFAAIALAAGLGGVWAGLAVFIVLTVGGIAWFLLQMRHLDARDPVGPVKATPDDTNHILVVANETVAGRGLHEEVRRATRDQPSRVLVISPALNSPLRHFVSDEDAARRAAQERLSRSLDALQAAGIEARGEVGDADPLQAIEDALRTFGADEIIISTHPEGRSNWLEKGVVSGAERRFDVPVTHVVVDLEAEAAASAPAKRPAS